MDDTFHGRALVHWKLASFAFNLGPHKRRKRERESGTDFVALASLAVLCHSVIRTSHRFGLGLNDIHKKKDVNKTLLGDVSPTTTAKSNY